MADPVNTAMLQQILGMMAPSGAASYPYAYGPEDPDEVGTLDYQSKLQTAMNKAAGLAADPSFRFSLGSTMGGFGPEMFEPVTEYTPVQAEGQIMLNRWRNSNDAFQLMVASLVDQGYDAGSIERQIQTVLSDPADPDREALMASIPSGMKQDLSGNSTLDPENPDWGYVRSAVSGLTSALAKDVGDWDGQTYDPATNAPAVARQVDSPTMQALREQGYTNTPYDTFDPDAFAPEGQARSDRLDQTSQLGRQSLFEGEVAKYMRAQDDLRKMQGSRNAPPLQPVQGAMARTIVPQQPQPQSPQVQPAQQGGDARESGPALPFAGVGRAIGRGIQRIVDQVPDDYYHPPDELPQPGIGGPIQSSQSSTPSQYTTARTSPRRPVGGRGPMGPEEQAAQARVDAQRVAMEGARDRQEAGALASVEARARRRYRQDLTNDLTANQITPFNLQQRAMQAAIWGL